MFHNGVDYVFCNITNPFHNGVDYVSVRNKYRDTTVDLVRHFCAICTPSKNLWFFGASFDLAADVAAKCSRCNKWLISVHIHSVKNSD
jgi:hypothetical protein